VANPLDQVASWPATAAVGVASAAGLLASTGPDDRPYAWASVTKLLVALAALDGVQRGLLDLDEPAGPPGSTIRHLLSHASGLGFDGDAILSPPGRRRIYSNRGIEIVADLLAGRSGQPFERLLAEAVCLPLEMADTRLEGSPAWGAVGPLRDLMTLAIELIRPRLIREDLLAEATRTAFGGLPGVLPGFGRQPHCDWGLGFEIRDAKEPHWTGSANSARTFGHFGRSGSFLWVDPAARIACACLADRDFGDWAKQAWPRLSDDVLASYAAKDLSGRTVLPQPPASITRPVGPTSPGNDCDDISRKILLDTDCRRRLGTGSEISLRPEESPGCPFSSTPRSSTSWSWPRCWKPTSERHRWPFKDAHVVRVVYVQAGRRDWPSP